MCAKAVSGFIASGSNYNVPIGYTLLILQLTTWDRQNLTATFNISATGYSETVQADASGRATKLVPSGATYTVSLTHGGSYLNDGDQTVVANSEEIAWVDFDLMEPAIAVYSNLAASVWTSDATYQEFPYRCALAINGVSATDTAWVTFQAAQATSGDYAPVCDTYDGGVYVYSKISDSITIANVSVFHTAR